ncbi:MAG: 2-succinyl-5-enolpyruvyl-6-hydroxy-3-cyclohexene-1-carboxylic-acid synthase [Opitutaceae bacterium]|nr:2-succinyl-5-enolpyruvyl-6-hydroxy-3-cyclohexene-1-carboxylic-acid synthase [Opitutaceae bacterium]
MPNLDKRTPNTWWCSVMVETLVRLGLRQAVISPGSRSTPLTVALVAHRAVECIPVLDERSAGFFALGLAKQSQRPVVLVCTSGTAAANYFPAVIEASESGVPLLVLTADRPPEMRACNSGQTIDQQKLYGDYVRWQHEVGVPEASEARLRYLRQTLVQAWERAAGAYPGPVHLNLPFRDPLVPRTDAIGVEVDLGDEEAFFSHLIPIQAPCTHATFWLRSTTARGLIVAGAAAPADPHSYVQSVLALARATGWPVLADVLSPVRAFASAEAGIITTYDTFLRHEALARQLTPRQVICLGGWPTSKVLRGWMETSQAETILLSPWPTNRDPLHGRTRQLVAPVEAVAVEGTPTRDPAYSALWQRAEKATRTRLRAAIEDPAAAGFEGGVAARLGEVLPPATPVFVAASMPVRDLEYFWPCQGGGQRLYFNRGANGIDGTLSTALGVAHGHAPSVLLTGDLAFLHDTNGLLLAPKLRGSLTVVVINNRGGGIFEHLSIAAYNPPFEDYFATPQQVDLGRLAEAYGVAHRLVPTWGELERELTSLPVSGLRILEFRTDRRQDAAFRKRHFGRVSEEAGREVLADV